jgi:glycosyltransferase involved in cell wall biosynthesis
MKVLFVTNHLNIGGITSYVLVLGRGLVKRGHTVFIASSGGQLLKDCEKAGMRFLPIPMRTKKDISPGIMLSAFSLSRMIKKHGIEVVHTQSRTTQVLGTLLRSCVGVVHVTTCHGFFRRRLGRRLFPCWGDRVIAISEAVAAHLKKDFLVDEKKITVVYNGIDTEKYAQYSRENGSAQKQVPSGPVIGIIARLSDVKGHMYLIGAMKIVLKRFPQARLLIIGEGKMEKELKRLVEDLGLSANVSFLPEVADTPAALASMDVFVMPSLHEGLGLALMEAMAAGCAVIGSDVGGIVNLIRHRQNGLLVRPADVPGLAAAIEELLGSETMRKELGMQAHEFIMREFSQEKMVVATEGVYRTCLNVKS